MTPPPAVAEETWRDVLAAVEVAARTSSSNEAELAEHLYSDWYLGVAAPDANEFRVRPPGPVDVNLVDVLRARHVDTGRWVSGWTVTSISNRGRIAVASNGQHRVVCRVDVLPVARPYLPPRIGERVSITARRDVVDPAGAFWFAYAGGWDENAIPPGLVRFYWNAPRYAAPSVVGSVTRHLAGTRTSYALKVAIGDADVLRPEGVVLYLTTDEVDGACPAIREAYREVAAQLRAAVPRLTLRLGHGLAVAEDPDTGESFGQHRCRLVAEAISHGLRIGSAGGAETGAALLEHVRAGGIDPKRPHLRPGSTKDYRWPPR